MNKKQWFVCLSFEDYDLLLPQDKVDGSSWMGQGSTIRCNGQTYTTTVIPHLEQLSLSDCRVFSGQLGELLLNKGLVGVHFTDRKIQYIIDDRFLSLSDDANLFHSESEPCSSDNCSEKTCSDTKGETLS